MADEKQDEILLKVKVDEEAVEQKIIDLRKQVIGLKNDKEELRKANKAGTISSDEFAKGITKANLAINAANKGIRENEKTLENNTKQRQAANGSLVQLRAQLSLATADFDGLSKEQRKNAEIGGKLQKQIKDLSDELKEEEEQTGRTYRNVGNYSAAIEQAIAGNTTWTGRLQGTVASLKQGKESISEYIKGLKGTTEGLGTAQKASVAFGLGLKAIGIGLLITAITAVIGFLSKMDGGMDKVEQATAAVSAGIDALIKVLAPLGEAIVNAVIHPFDTAVSAVEAFDQALKHPFDTLKNLAAGSRKLTDDIATNVGKAARAAIDYTKAMQDIEDEQDGLISQQAKVNQQVSLALIATKDRSKSEREKIAALDAAGKAEQELSDKVVALKKRELALLIELQKSNTNLQDADKKALQEAKAAAINAETANKETQQQIQNRRSAQLEQAAAAEKAAADKSKEAAKKRTEESVNEAERALIMAQKKGIDTLAIEEEIVRRQLKADSIGLSKRSQQRRLLEAKADADILALKVKNAVEIADKTYALSQTHTGRLLTLSQRGSQQELALQKKQLEDKYILDRATANATIKDAKLRRQTLLGLDAKFGVDTEQLDDAFAKGQLDRDADLTQKRLQTQIDLGQKTFAIEIENGRQQIALEEKTALALLDLDEKTAKERGQLDERLRDELLVKRNAIQAKALAANRELTKQQAERKRADAIALAEARVIAAADGSKKELDARKDLLKKQRDAEIAAAKDNAAEIARIKAQYRDQEEKLDNDFNEKLVNNIIQATSLAKDALSAGFEAQTQIATALLDKQQQAALRSAGTNADLRGKIEEQYQKKREKLEKEAAERRRKIASIENLIATAQAGTAALKLFAENPILGAITEGLILYKAIKNQQLIDAQAFAEGGQYLSDGRGSYVRGPGTGTSDSINARLSNGEGVVNARSMAMFYDQISAINVAGGGRKFPGADEVVVPQLTNFAYGGVPQSSGSDLGQVVKAIQDLNIFVTVTDIDQVKADMTKAKAAGDY